MKMRAEDELEREQDHYCRACQVRIRAAPKLVHYGWPGACGGFAPGDLWTGNLDRVTCPACLRRPTGGREEIMTTATSRPEPTDDPGTWVRVPPNTAMGAARILRLAADRFGRSGFPDDSDSCTELAARLERAIKRWEKG